MHNMICMDADIKHHAEYSIHLGRIDLTMEFAKVIYVTKVKFNDTAENAMKQIEERQYYKRFLSYGKQVILLGIASKREPNAFDIEYVEKQL